MQAELISIGDRAVPAVDNWQKAYADILNIGVSPDSANAHTPGLTVDDVASRISTGLAAMTKLHGAKSDQLVVIFNRLPALKESVDVINQKSMQISEDLGSWEGATSVDQNGQLNLSITHPEKGSRNYDLGSLFADISNRATTLLEALPYVAVAVSDRDVAIYVGSTRTVAEHLAQAKSTVSQAKRELKDGETVVANLKKLSDSASTMLKQIEELKTSILATKGTTDTQAAEITQKLAQVDGISQNAGTLQQKIADYQPQFDAFRDQMNERLERFRQFEESSKKAENLNKGRESKIDELTNKADTMIRGATTAGLSKSLEDAKSEYDRRLTRARLYFVGSVVFLLLSALPIAAQLVPGPWQQHFAAAPQVSGELPFLLSALGRLVLVLPAAWACSFFSKDYAELFHLSREYAHKAALAKAVDGFRREAPRYEQEITGSVFLEIQENPGTRKAPSAAKPNNPIIEELIEKARSILKQSAATPPNA